MNLATAIKRLSSKEITAIFPEVSLPDETWLTGEVYIHEGEKVSIDNLAYRLVSQYEDNPEIVEAVRDAVVESGEYDTEADEFA